MGHHGTIDPASGRLLGPTRTTYPKAVDLPPDLSTNMGVNGPAILMRAHQAPLFGMEDLAPTTLDLGVQALDLLMVTTRDSSPKSTILTLTVEIDIPVTGHPGPEEVIIKTDTPMTVTQAAATQTMTDSPTVTTRTHLRAVDPATATTTFPVVQTDIPVTGQV